MIRSRISLAIVVIALAAIVALAVESARRFGSARIELDRAKAVELSPATRARLAHLDTELMLAWYRTPPESMPAGYRELEAEMRALLENIRAAAPDKVRVQIVDPDVDPQYAGYLANVGIAPVRVRHIERDGWVEERLWSSLRIVDGAHGAAVIQRLGPDEFASLQALIVAHLDELEKPRRPRLVLSAPEGCRALRGALQKLGDVTDIDFDTDAKIPDDADLLFWIDPTRADAAQLSALHRFLDRGGSVVVAGSRYRASFASGEPAVRFEKSAFPADALLPEFGLRPASRIVLDARADETNGVGSLPTHLVRAIGANQDFRKMHGLPNGALLFAAPTTFDPDAARLAELGLECTALAATSERTFDIAWTSAPIPLAAMQPTKDTRFGARAPLLALVRPIDPWHGSLVFASSSSPFTDARFNDQAYAHEELVRVLVRTLASADRRAVMHATIERPAPVPELSSAARGGWRAFVLLVAPLALLSIAFAKGVFRSSASTSSAKRTLRAVGISLAAIAITATVVAIAPARTEFDWTREGASVLSDATIAIASRAATGAAPVSIQIAFSDEDRWSAEMRPLARRARELTRRIARVVDDVSVRELHPDDDEASAAAIGITPMRTTSVSDETLVVRRVYASIALVRGDRREVLDFPDAASFDNLEFRLAFAFQRLALDRRPTVAIAADVPRLSPAEALLEYQKKGLFAPSEGDVYSEARALLEHNDFHVVTLDPNDPKPPEDTDVVVWLQPRRDIKKAVVAFSEELARGKALVVCAQEHVVRARQKQAKDLALALWPEPQFPDLEDYYFPKIGVDMRTSIVFDDSHGTIDIDASVERATGRTEVVRAPLSSPLVVRVPSSSFDAHEVLLRGVGDQLWPYPSRIELDPVALTAQGLRARTLLSTSARSWDFDWKGGDLPSEVLEAPRTGFAARQPLAVFVEGTFPPPSIDPALASTVAGRAPFEARPGGRLVVLGSSEAFKNARLHLAGTAHADLLVNIVANLALDPVLASILARRNVEPGFEFVEPRARIGWRVFVLGSAPLVLALFAFAWSRWRRRASTGVRTATVGGA